MRKVRFIFYATIFAVLALTFSFGTDYAINFGSGFASVLFVTLSSFYSIRKKVAKAVADDKTWEDGDPTESHPLCVPRDMLGKLACSFTFSCSLVRFLSFLFIGAVLILLLELNLFSFFPYLIGLAFGNVCILVLCVLWWLAL